MKTKKSAVKNSAKSPDLDAPKIIPTTKVPVREEKPPVKALPETKTFMASAPAPEKVLTPKSSAPSPAHTNGVTSTTTIEVKMDVGFGNAVFLRGQGAGLTWDRGLPLVCVDARTWRWSGEVKDPITFKLLINDQIWSAGGDLKVAPGQKLEVSPSFA